MKVVMLISLAACVLGLQSACEADEASVEDVPDLEAPPTLDTAAADPVGLPPPVPDTVTPDTAAMR